jgi:hypothetical protein
MVMPNDRRLSHASRGELELMRRSPNQRIIKGVTNRSMVALKRKGFVEEGGLVMGAGGRSRWWHITPAGIERLEKGK